MGIVTTADNEQVVNKSDLLILAVKPKDVENVLKTIKQSLVPNNHLLVSIAAGIRTKTIEEVDFNYMLEIYLNSLSSYIFLVT